MENTEKTALIFLNNNSLYIDTDYLNKIIKMRYDAITIMCPDILEYIKGRDEVCTIVLSFCQEKSGNEHQQITLHTTIFAMLHFSSADIIKIIQNTGKRLRVRFSYCLIMQIDNDFTVEDLATLLWKYMYHVIKYS